MTRVLTAGALLLSLAGRVSAADAVAEGERAVQAAVEVRDQARQDREGKSREAAALADEIGRLKAAHEGVRAEGRLEERLRAFDRVAAALDVLDRKVEAAEAAVGRAQRAFEAAAGAESERRGGDGAADRAVALEEARARVRAATDAPTFRPPLLVRRAAEDGPADIEGKLQLLEAERRRVEEELGRLEAEDLVRGERLAGKRRLAASLAAARGQASSPLFEREADELRRAIVRLVRESETDARARAERHAALQAVAAMVQELKAR